MRQVYIDITELISQSSRDQDASIADFEPFGTTLGQEGMFAWLPCIVEMKNLVQTASPTPLSRRGKSSQVHLSLSLGSCDTAVWNSGEVSAGSPLGGKLKCLGGLGTHPAC